MLAPYVDLGLNVRRQKEFYLQLNSQKYFVRVSLMAKTLVWKFRERSLRSFACHISHNASSQSITWWRMLILKKVKWMRFYLSVVQPGYPKSSKCFKNFLMGSNLIGLSILMRQLLTVLQLRVQFSLDKKKKLSKTHSSWKLHLSL